MKNKKKEKKDNNIILIISLAIVCETMVILIVDRIMKVENLLLTIILLYLGSLFVLIPFIPFVDSRKK